MINTLGGAGAEMALLELLEKLIKENEKTKDVQYEISLYVLMGQGELIKRLPKEVILKNKSYQPLSVLQKKGRYFMYRTILKTMFVRGNGPPRHRWVGVLRGRSPTLELRHGPNSYGRQQ